MKRLTLCLFAVALLLCTCAAPSALSLGDGDALLTLDGGTIVTVLDLRRAVAANEFSDEKYSEKDLFCQISETRLLAHYAEEYGVAKEAADYLDQFDRHLLEIQDTETYGNAYADAMKLKETLGMDDEAFRQWNAAEAALSASVEAFIDYIAESYGHLTSPASMNEAILENLDALLADAQLVSAYPGLSNYSPTFSSVVS